VTVTPYQTRAARGVLRLIASYLSYTEHRVTVGYRHRPGRVLLLLGALLIP
jgi:hypothetical protein